MASIIFQSRIITLRSHFHNLSRPGSEITTLILGAYKNEMTSRLVAKCHSQWSPKSLAIYTVFNLQEFCNNKHYTMY